PSLSMDGELLERVSGFVHYEERLLSLLMLLRMPRTHVVYVTSIPIDPVIVDYYLHLLPGITGNHARQRLTMLSCFDSSSKPLSQKILDRPRLMERIRYCVPTHNMAHITAFNTTKIERSLSVQLNLPLFGCDPDLLFHGSKSGSRKIFKQCGLNLPPGFEDLSDEDDIIDALTALKMNNRHLKRAVLKVNEGFSGEGNAIFSFDGCPENGSIKSWIKRHIRDHLLIIAHDFNYDIYMGKFMQMGGIAEEFISGEIKRSPSAQCIIDPLGNAEVISTHDQVLGGEGGQVFIGANFPANEEYAQEIGMNGLRVAQELREYGVLGRFSIDFISVKEPTGWNHYAVEINLRKGGTTHPNLMLQGLTVGKYDIDRGIYLTANGQRRYYFSSDNVKNDQYKGLTPPDLIDIAIYNRMQYDGSSQQGVMFHLIGALSQYGKLGVVCIGDSPSRANAFYRRTLQVLNKETRVRPSTTLYSI
ncbi:MAG: peptide ligase PGM1-related protein, partial [Chitinophagales bacterium]